MLLYYYCYCYCYYCYCYCYCYCYYYCYCYCCYLSIMRMVASERPADGDKSQPEVALFIYSNISTSYYENYYY